MHSRYCIKMANCDRLPKILQRKTHYFCARFCQDGGRRVKRSWWCAFAPSMLSRKLYGYRARSLRDQSYGLVHAMILVKVKWSRYRPGVAQRVGRGIALLFHDRGTRRGWVVSSTPLAALYPPEKTRYPFYRRLGGPQGQSGWTENLIPTRIWSQTVLSVAQSLYQLSYLAHTCCNISMHKSRTHISLTQSILILNYFT